MAVARRILLSGHACLHPGPLGLSDEATCNSVSCPVGFEPGRATLAVSREVGDALDLNAAHTISFIDGATTVVLSGYYIDRAPVVHVDGDLKACRVIELFDKRALMILSGINRRINCLKPLPYHLDDSSQVLEKYFDDSLQSDGTLHTWATGWTAVWARLPSIAGAEPSLPYTPAGRPKGFTFNGSAWAAAEEYLAAICCTVRFNPITDLFEIVRLSQTQSGLAAAIAAATAAGKLLFHSRDLAGPFATDTPEKYFILAPQQHVQNDDHTERGEETDTASGVSNAVSGTRDTYWITTPETFCDTGGAQNLAEITARATDYLAELSGKAQTSNGDGHVEFSGALSSILPGSQCSLVRWRDYGNDGDDSDGGMRTEIHQVTQDLFKAPRQDINTDKLIRVRLDEPLAPGQSADATVVVYDFDLDDWFPDACTLTVYDPLNMAGGGLPEGFQLYVKWHYDSERWEIFSVPEGVVFFQAIQDKELTTPNPFQAVILVFDGTDWVSSGIVINVHDEYHHEPNTHGFFTGKATIDRGWAKLQEISDDPQTPDDYVLIWMSGPAHIVRFELTADRTSASEEAVDATIHEYYLYGHDQLQPTSVWFPAAFFPRALSGALGVAIYNDRERRYEVVQCDQMGLHATAILTADMCGSTSAFSDFTIATFFPFSQSPNPAPSTGLNLNNHCGESGDVVKLIWLEYLGEWDVYDVTKKEVEVITNTRTVITGDGEGECVTEFFWQPVCIEYCEEGEWRTFDYCCCADGDVTVGGGCTSDSTNWTTLEFYDKTLDCTCLPQFGISAGGQSWSTNTCPGNITWALTCNATTGLPELTGGGGQVATLISYTPGVEIRFQLPDLGANCGGAGGTAKVVITP